LAELIPPLANRPGWNFLPFVREGVKNVAGALLIVMTIVVGFPESFHFGPQENMIDLRFREWMRGKGKYAPGMTTYRYEKAARPDFVQMNGQRRKNPDGA
jgi:hypothetical protein